MPKFNVTRSIEINASPEEVFDRVADFGTWTTWSPWLCAEPEAKVTVTENPNSVGSVYAWDGEVVGAGEVEHKTLERGKKIRDEIRFLRPMKSVSEVGFDLEPSHGGTKLSWLMNGSLPFFLFWMKSGIQSFLSMDYDRGLKMFKEWVETGNVRSRTSIAGVQPMGPIQVIGVRRTATLSDIGQTMDSAFESATEQLQKNNLPTDSERISVYHDMNMKSQSMEFTAGYLFGSPVEVPAEMSSWSMPNMQTLRVDHRGSYEHLGNAWSAANQYARYKKMKQSKIGAFELYKNDPRHTEPEHLLTEVFLPLK